MFKGKTSFSKAIITIAILLLSSLPAFADNRIHNPPSTFIVVEPYGTEQCVSGNVAICGQTVSVPGQALGYSATLAVPSPYVHQPFTVQCTPAGYQIIDASSVTCSLLTCPAANVSLCGASIPVMAGTTIGATTTVPVPASVLADPALVSSGLSFTVQCVDDGNGGTVYQIAESSGISCDLFPCPDSRIRLCEKSIPVTGGTPLGGVLHLTMPPPFTPDPYTVQCVGSSGNPPVYQVTDVSAVTCNIAPPVQ